MAVLAHRGFRRPTYPSPTDFEKRPKCTLDFLVTLNRFSLPGLEVYETLLHLGNPFFFHCLDTW